MEVSLRDVRVSYICSLHVVGASKGTWMPRHEFVQGYTCMAQYIYRRRHRRVVHGSLFLDPTRPGETLTRPNSRLLTRSPTRPDPTHGPTLPLYV